MNEISYIGGISGRLAPFGGAAGAAPLEWTCRREGFLRDIHVGQTVADLITLHEFNIVHASGITESLTDGVEEKTAAGVWAPTGSWSRGVSLACFAGLLNEHGAEVWVEPGDIIRVRVLNRTSEPLQFDLGLLFLTRSLATTPRLWWARIEDGILVQPVKPDAEAPLGTRRGDYVVVNPYTYEGFEEK